MEPVYTEPSAVALLGRSKDNWASAYENLFKDCPIGKSFLVKLEDVKFPTLVSMVYRYGIKNNKKFKAVKHATCYEVYRKE